MGWKLAMVLSFAALTAISPVQAQTCPPLAEIYGTVERVDSATMVVITRVQRRLKIDLSAATAAGRVQTVRVGLAVRVLATRGPPGVLLAQSVARAKASPVAWRPDCIPFAGF
jgi:hypothetical protein